MSSVDGDLNAKDRKKSAHWTEVDTQVLIRLLLRYKDNGRTADNGFKPEVWQEAADMLQGATLVGGPKTPEACKSRWQRLQRDYKAAKDMQAVPGFSWDPVAHRLAASSETWDAAEKQFPAYKYRKIHLPCYDSLTILCPTDVVRLRQRAKIRPSMPASDNSFGMGMSDGGGGGGGASGPGRLTNDSNNGHEFHGGNNGSGHVIVNGNGNGTGNGNGHGSGNGNENGKYGHGHDIEGSGSHSSNGLTNSQSQGLHENGMLMWEGTDVDGDGSFDASFTMPDTSFTLAPQKRMYDNPVITSSNTTSNRMPSTITPRTDKKARMSTPHRPPQRLSYPMQSQPQPQNQSHSQTTPHGNTDPRRMYLPLGQRSPDDFPSSGSTTTIVDPSMLHSPTSGLTNTMQMNHPQPLPLQYQNQNQSQPHRSPHQSTVSHSILQSQPQPQIQSRSQPQPIPAHTTTQQPQNTHQHSHSQSHTHTHNPNPNPNPHPNLNLSLSQHHSPTINLKPSSLSVSGSSTSASLTTPTSSSLLGTGTHQYFPPISPEASLAGMTDPQRRTEAIIQLQNKEGDMKDEDLCEILKEFEESVAACDTYLAIKREALRRMWLISLVRRRRGS